MTIQAGGPFVGRDRELASIQAAAARAVEAGALVIVTGDAGIGKSRLMVEATHRLESAGAQSLHGACVDIPGGGLPFGPFVQALQPALRAGGVAAPILSDTATVLPGLTELPQAGATGRIEADEFERVRVFRSVASVLDALARERPTVLAIDDLQWADASSLGLLAWLIRVARIPRLIVIATTRSDALSRSHPVAGALIELQRDETVTRLDLGPLGDDAMLEIVTSLVGSAADAASITARAEGNPFAAGQLALWRDDTGASGLPPSIRDWILVRLSQRSERAQIVAAAAAIGEAPLNERVIGVVTGLGAEDVARALRELVDARILRHDGDALRFAHDLVREAIASDQLPAERRRLHAAHADALSATDRQRDAATLARIAHHREAAGEPLPALESMLAAAEAAAAGAAFEVAASFLRRALGLWADSNLRAVPSVAGRDRADVGLQLGAALGAIGDQASAIDAVRTAIAAIDTDVEPLRAARAWLRLGEHLLRTFDPERLDAGRRAVELVPDTPPSQLRAEALFTYGSELLGRGDASGAPIVAQAAHVAELAGDEVHAAVARSALAFSAFGTLGGDELVPAVRNELEVMRRVGRTQELAVSYLNAIQTISLYALDHDEAIALAWEAWSELSRRGAWGWMGGDIIETAVEACWRAGRWAEGDRFVGALPRGPGGYGVAHGRYAIARLAIARGDEEAAVAGLAALEADAGVFLGDTQTTRGRWQREALFRAWARAPDETVAWWRSLPRLATGFVTEWVADAEIARYVIQAAVDGVQRAQAAAQRAELVSAVDDARSEIDELDRVDRMASRELDAHRLTAIAEVSRLHREGAAPWMAAAEAWGSLRQPWQVAYCQYREAEVRLVQGGDRRAAEQALRAAHAIAVELGAAPLLAEIEGLARRARVGLEAAPPPPAAPVVATPADPHGLTEREREVLALLVAGRTNREIGASLFISPKTAGVHVSNILGKLGAANRVEAASIAHRLGIVAP